MPSERDFFIASIPLVDLQGSKSIPTVLFYPDDGRVLIGADARAAADVAGREKLNEDFKMDLGNDNPASNTDKRRFRTANGLKKSAGDLTGDFFLQLLRHVEEWLPMDNVGSAAGIVVAEPLTMSDSEADPIWLANYRSNIRRILIGRRYSKEQIDFLPEPFAVFQYYKYGMRHPLLSGTAKHTALVIDFGGGSFDVCIIETDREGEITTKRKNTRPLAASSASVGGFYVNKCLAEAMFLKYCREDKLKRTLVRQGIDIYGKWRKHQVDLNTSKAAIRNFVKYFHNAIYDLEDPKLALSNSISNWDLETPLNESVQFRFPKDPFIEDSTYFVAELTGNEFREVFLSKVWHDRIEPLIRSAIERGKGELLGEPITIVLLSGGSCNIRWLSRLVDEHFAVALEGAQVLQLDDDFQEVVAKGVAAECARRYYDSSSAGDFTSVTYNRLHLVLDPDEKGFQLKVFQPVDGNPIGATNKHGVLLPSASHFKNRFDVPLTWKVRLDRPPRRSLDYFFLRSGFSPHKLLDDEQSGEAMELYSDELLNFDHKVYSPPDCSFDSHLHVQLTISKETKTARTRFIYSKATNVHKEVAVEGKPFYLDMTDTQDAPVAKAYIGLDFGTSNTSVSYVSESSVKIYERRSQEKHWLDLAELHRILPFPMAAPLAKYLSESYDARTRIYNAREFVEGVFAIAAYASYMDYCSSMRRDHSKYLKGLNQRSVGPLWHFLGEVRDKLKGKSDFTAVFNRLVEEPFAKEIDESVTFFAKHKHEKIGDAVFNPRIVTILANIAQRMFAKSQFGYFENVQQQRFTTDEYRGIFRVACGTNEHFTESIEYSGSQPFPSRTPYIIDFEKRTALSMEPLTFWFSCEAHPTEEHLYLFDGAKDDRFSYKAANYECSLEFDKSHPGLHAVAERMMGFVGEDPQLQLVKF